MNIFDLVIDYFKRFGSVVETNEMLKSLRNHDDILIKNDEINSLKKYLRAYLDKEYNQVAANVYINNEANKAYIYQDYKKACKKNIEKILQQRYLRKINSSIKNYLEYPTIEKYDKLVKKLNKLMK